MGYDYKQASLSRMTKTLRGSAQHLSNATSGAPPSPDAGDSSALLAEVISDLLRSGATIAAKQELIAGNIHASKGSYDEIENTNEGLMNQQKRTINNYTHGNQWTGS